VAGAGAGGYQHDEQTAAWLNLDRLDEDILQPCIDPSVETLPVAQWLQKRHGLGSHTPHHIPLTMTTRHQPNDEQAAVHSVGER
jgi:hypothetical protein